MGPESPRTTVRLDSTDSTSALARRRIAAGDLSGHGAVFVAATQTNGVGRLGRAWASPRGGLWCTLAQPIDPAAVEGLGLRVGEAMCAAIQTALVRAGSAARVVMKQPNDALIEGRKVAGVLTEILAPTRPERPVSGTKWALVGVGINANFAYSDLPEPLRATATTLRDCLRIERIQRDIDLEALLADLTERLTAAITAPANPAGSSPARR